MSVVSTKYGKMRIIEADKVVSHALALYGEWAMDELNLLAELITPGMCVLDVGAFIGTHSLAFSKFVGEKGKVYSFEPRKEIFHLLSTNLLLNNCNNATPMNMGLAETDKNLPLQSLDLNDSVNFGGLSLDSVTPSQIKDMYQIHVSTIDNLGLGKIDLIKLDVEGMERNVLDGAIKTMLRDRPIVFCECNSLSSGYEILEFCQQYQYDVYGFLASAYNPSNFNKIEENIWGEAKEFALLLVPIEKSNQVVDTLRNTNIFQIENIEDLVLPLLHKPQYAHEVLASTSSASLLGIQFPSPLLVNQNAKIFELNSTVLNREAEIVTLTSTVLNRDDEIATLTSTVLNRDDEITTLTSTVLNRDDEIKVREANIATLEQNSKKTEILTAELRDEIAQFQSSSSWKITKPLRWISKRCNQSFRITKIVQKYLQTYPGFSGIKRICSQSINTIRRGGVDGFRSRISLYERIADTNTIQEKVSIQTSDTHPLETLCKHIEIGLIAKPTIIFDHNGGGGANTYTHELVKDIKKDGGTVLRVYSFDAIWFVHWIGNDDELLCSTSSIELLFEALSSSRSTNIILNSIYGYSNIELATSKIEQLVKSLNAKLDFKIHDFYALCPSPHLSDFEQKYCGVPQDFDTCKNCLKTNVNWYHSWYPKENRPTDIVTWRKSFAQLLDNATTVTFFDNSSVEILKKGFTIDQKKIKVVPHLMSHFQCDTAANLSGPLHIGILGTLSHIKGGNAVQELCQYIDDLELAIPVSVIGHSYTELPAKVYIHGSYSVKDLPEIINRQGINFILMPSIIPETFSYTISEAMTMGLPIVAFDIGAQGNRVKNYNLGKVVPLGSTSEVILTAIQSSLTAAQELKI
jgi:FkbM family methyltransferase